MQFVEATTLAQELCATTTCTLIGDRSIKIETTQESAKQAPIEGSLGGIKNNRSMQPSGSFQITTYDTDGVSLIDVGYNKNVATTIAGDITWAPIGRDSTVNGATNVFTFEMTTSIPMQAGDVLKFSFPPQVVVNANGETTECVALLAGDEFICGISGNDV